MGWPSPASHTFRTELAFIRSANGPLKAFGMCWVMTIPGTSDGRLMSTCLMASVPPVDAPMAMMRSVVAKCVGALRFGSTASASWRSTTTIDGTSSSGRTWACAAIFTLEMISREDSLMPWMTSTVGLATKSTAPKESASSATAAPCCVSEEHITTGMGRSRMRLRRKASPSMRGISTSSVSTSGLSNLIFSRATYGSGADPTTSMPGSEFRISVNSWRITAESSTTRTRIFLSISGVLLKEFHGAGLDLNVRRRELPLALEHCNVERRGQALHPHLAGRRAVVDLTRETVAEILGADEKAFGLEVLADELRIAPADIEGHIEHLAAADHFELQIRPLAAQGHDVVDQPLHRDVAVARRGADQVFRPGTGAARPVERQHEVIHPADTQLAVAHAGRDTGAEHGEDGLVVARDVVVARQQFGDGYAQIRVPGAADVPELGQRRRQRRLEFHPRGRIQCAHSTRRYTVRPTSL